jgi:hypothetical protein
MTKLDTNNFNHIMNDFNMLTQIFLYTDKCSPKELIRHEEASKRHPGRFTLQEFISKNE